MPETHFSLRSFTGNRGTDPGAPPEADEVTATRHAALDLAEAGIAAAEPLDPVVETQPRISGSHSGAREPGSSFSWPSLPASERAAWDLGITWQPPQPSAPVQDKPATQLQPTPELVPLPSQPEALEQVEEHAPPAESSASSGMEALEQVEVPAPPAESLASSGTEAQSGAPRAPLSKPRRLNPWTVVAGIPVFLLVFYLVLLPASFYLYRIMQARQTDAITLVADLGHGGDSQVTVMFTSDDWLQVTEIDNEDPTRVTELSVTQVIALADNKVVVEARFQAILQPERMDLIIQLDSGQAFQPVFTTILINNVAAVKMNQHAPGLRAPTASELQQARQKLGT